MATPSCEGHGSSRAEGSEEATGPAEEQGSAVIPVLVGLTFLVVGYAGLLSLIRSAGQTGKVPFSAVLYCFDVAAFAALLEGPVVARWIGVVPASGHALAEHFAAVTDLPLLPLPLRIAFWCTLLVYCVLGKGQPPLLIRRFAWAANQFAVASGLVVLGAAHWRAGGPHVFGAALLIPCSGFFMARGVIRLFGLRRYWKEGTGPREDSSVGGPSGGPPGPTP